MSTLTDILNLFKYNTEEDGKSTFNFTLSLNNNWDKIDNWAKKVNEQQTNLKAAIPTLLSQLQNNMDFITESSVAKNSLYTNIYTSGNNFYIEFFNNKEKTNRVLLIQLGSVIGFNTVTFLKPFNKLFGIFSQVIGNENCIASVIKNQSTTSFYVSNGGHGGGHFDSRNLNNFWVAFGT